MLYSWIHLISQQISGTVQPTQRYLQKECSGQYLVIYLMERWPEVNIYMGLQACLTNKSERRKILIT